MTAELLAEPYQWLAEITVPEYEYNPDIAAGSIIWDLLLQYASMYDCDTSIRIWYPIAIGNIDPGFILSNIWFKNRSLTYCLDIVAHASMARWFFYNGKFYFEVESRVRMWQEEQDATN